MELAALLVAALLAVGAEAQGDLFPSFGGLRPGRQPVSGTPTGFRNNRFLNLIREREYRVRLVDGSNSREGNGT